MFCFVITLSDFGFKAESLIGFNHLYGVLPDYGDEFDSNAYFLGNSHLKTGSCDSVKLVYIDNLFDDNN
jgi:hypothetical protein